MLTCGVKQLPPFGVFDPDEMTDVQKAFWVGLTDQRIANIWEASDYIAELPQEAKDFLRNADKAALKWMERASPEDIAQLQYSIKFMEASKLLGRVTWVIGGTMVGSIITAVALWDKFAAFFKKAGP